MRTKLWGQSGFGFVQNLSLELSGTVPTFIHLSACCQTRRDLCGYERKSYDVEVNKDAFQWNCLHQFQHLTNYGYVVKKVKDRQDLSIDKNFDFNNDLLIEIDNWQFDIWRKKTENLEREKIGNLGKHLELEKDWNVPT